MSRLFSLVLVLPLLAAPACSQDAFQKVYPDLLGWDRDGSLDTGGIPGELGLSDAAVSDAGGAGSGPPYPFVFAHGFFGFEQVATVDYFWKLKPALEGAGYLVTMTAVDPFNSTEVRGEQLLTQVKAYLAQTGAAKVNLVGHSQGGLDARYVACKIPDRVASVTTVATPHLGASIADILLDKTGGWSQQVAEAFLKALAPKVYGDPAGNTSIKASLEFMRTSNMVKFNAKYPDQAGIKYYSMGGRSDNSDGGSTCYAPMAPPFITQYSGVKDPIDPLLYLLALVLEGSHSNPKVVDGIIQTEATKWGTWLGCVPADHIDQVGHLFGDSPGKGNTFDHIAFYKGICAWLRIQGF